MSVEIRFKGANVMPGYWRAPAETEAAFDEEGYYRTGDAVLYVDDTDAQRGLCFDGRIAEDIRIVTETTISLARAASRLLVVL